MPDHVRVRGVLHGIQDVGIGVRRRLAGQVLGELDAPPPSPIASAAFWVSRCLPQAYPPSMTMPTMATSTTIDMATMTSTCPRSSRRARRLNMD